MRYSGELSRRAGGVHALPALFLYPLPEALARAGSESEAREKREGLRLCVAVAAVCSALGECPAGKRKPVPLLGGLAFCRGGGVQLTPKVNGVDGKKRGVVIIPTLPPAQKNPSMSMDDLPPDSGGRHHDHRDGLPPWGCTLGSRPERKKKFCCDAKKFFQRSERGKKTVTGARPPCGKVALYGFQAVEKC